MNADDVYFEIIYTINIKQQQNCISIQKYYPVVLPNEPSSVTIPLLSNTLTKYRNTFNKIKIVAKESYFANLLNEYKNDLRKTLTVVNKLIGRK